METVIKYKSWSLLALILILFIAWLNLLYLPAGSSRKANLEEVSSFQNEINRSQRLIAEAGQIRESLTGVESDLNQCLDLICPTDSVGLFIEMIEKRMQSFGMVDYAVVPRIPDILSDEKIRLGKGHLNRIDFELKAQGRYIQIGKFIEDLQDENFFAGSSHIDISHSQSINPRVVFNMTFTAFLRGRES